MRRITFSVCLSVAAGGALVAVSPAPAQETCYRLVDLGDIGYEAGLNDIFGINNANQAVFTAMVGGKKHAMLYLPADAFGLAAGVHDLHTLAGPAVGDASAVHDLNDAGIAVGWAEFGVERHAFVWRLDTDPFEFINLGTFANGDWSEAWAINNDIVPIIVGDGENKDDCTCDSGNLDITRAFWLPLTDPPNLLPSAVQLLQAPEGIVGCDQNTTARDVNTNGIERTAAGYSASGTPICPAPECCGATNDATVWQNPVPMNPVGTALDLLDPAGGTFGRGISDVGAIVGSGFTSGSCGSCQEHALYWHTDADPPLDLGLASGVDPSHQSRAVRINNNQSPQTLQAVGWQLASPDLAFLWECDSGCDVLASWSARDLNNAIEHCSVEWSIRRAHDVNDDGWIIGVGTFAGQKHAVLLAPLEDCEVCCFADLDCGGIVGASDLLALLAAWGPCAAPPVVCDGDLDCDGDVDAEDLLWLLAAWGTCDMDPPTEIPKTVEDCYNRFYPQDMDALIACIEAIE